MSMRVVGFFLLCCGASAQRFEFGVIGGTPVSETTRSEAIGTRAGYGPWSLSTRRYTVGGLFEIGIPFGLRVEADALFKRADTTQSSFYNPTFGMITRLAANSWEFPMLLKHRWNGRFQPFAGVGGTFRRIEGFDGSVEMFAGGFTPPYSVSRYRVDEPLMQGGMVGEAGAAVLRFGRMKIAPEFRYTRWTSIRFLPAQNQMEVLVAVTFH